MPLFRLLGVELQLQSAAGQRQRTSKTPTPVTPGKGRGFELERLAIAAQGKTLCCQRLSEALRAPAQRIARDPSRAAPRFRAALELKLAAHDTLQPADQLTVQPLWQQGQQGLKRKLTGL